MAGRPKRLSIIIPSFNDARIFQAIDSVRAFDDSGEVEIVLIDGGSKPELVAQIAERMTEDDVFVSERDKGIFDALNKGLAAARGEFIGWIGSDDAFTGEVKSREVIENLEACDLYVAATAHVSGEAVTRITRSWSSRRRLTHLVINNPHFSTFGRAALLKSERFALDLRGSDIAYFLRIFAQQPRVRTTPKIATFMEVGGYSNLNYKTSLRMHAELFTTHRRYMPAPLAFAALATKLGTKYLASLIFKLRGETRQTILK
ncbi:glycosyltransferase [Sphingoaurantiacus capsulatus]|uniref:Glycosyltransferase n=1 Tax=Sphingoaurantiacus capsulatus TaxID=1771310 RepID=A0ABV7XB21_9SPHN